MASILIVAFSLLLFLYWFRYSCTLLLRGCESEGAERTVEDARFSFIQVRRRYVSGWRGYDRTLAHPPDSLRGVSGNEWRALTGEYYLSANVLKASEDKTFFWRHTCQFDRALGPGCPGRFAGEHLLQRIQGSLGAGPLRSLDRTSDRRRPQDRGAGAWFPALPSTAARRILSAKQPDQRAAGPRLVGIPAG